MVNKEHTISHEGTSNKYKYRLGLTTLCC